MLKIKLVIFLLFSFTIIALSQNSVIDKGGRVILSQMKGINNVSFYIYIPPMLAKAIYKDTTAAINQYPEQLMSSIISATDQAWVEYNTLGGEKNSEKKDSKSFDFIKTMNKEKNYFELRSKLNFSMNSSEYSIIKFYFHTTELPDPTSGAYVMQKLNNKWYSTSNHLTSDIALMMMRFQEQKLLTILKAQPTGNSIMDDLIKAVTTTNGVSFTLLYKEFSNWYSNNDSQKIEYFIDPKAW